MPGFTAALLLCALNAQNDFLCLKENGSPITLKKEALTVELKSPLQVGSVSSAGVCVRDNSENVRRFNGDGLEILWRSAQGQKRESPKALMFRQNSDVLCSQSANSKLSCFLQQETLQEWEFWGQRGKEIEVLTQDFQVSAAGVCFANPTSELRCFERPKEKPQGGVWKSNEWNFTDTFGRKLQLKTARFYLDDATLCGIFTDEKDAPLGRCFDATGKEFLSQTKTGFSIPFPLGERVDSDFGLCSQSEVKNSPGARELSCYHKESKKPLEFFNDKGFPEAPPAQGIWVGHKNSSRLCLNGQKGAQCWKEGKKENSSDATGRKISLLPGSLFFFEDLICSQSPALRCWNDTSKEITFLTENSFRIETSDFSRWQANSTHLCGLRNASGALACFRHSGAQVSFTNELGGKRVLEGLKNIFLN